MAWRLHLANQAIQQLHLMNGNPPLVAVWSRRDRVAFYHLESGVMLGEKVLEFPQTDDRQADEWRSWLSSLCAPNGTFLPVVHTPQTTIYTSEDGRMRLYHADDALYLDTEGNEAPLEAEDDTEFSIVAFDRLMGLTAALDSAARLHIYQQTLHVGTFDVGLTNQVDLRPMVAIARGGSSIFASDGQRIVQVDSTGKVVNQRTPHFLIRQMVCSPNGRYLVLCDLDTGVIRVYSSKDLALTHQRFAIDLVASATQVQLLADMPPAFVAASALAVNDAGIIGFAMAGIMCITELSHLDQLPQPQITG